MPRGNASLSPVLAIVLVLAAGLLFYSHSPDVPPPSAPEVVDAPPDDPAQTGRRAAKVVRIVDGDTVEVLMGDQQPLKLRLNGIDCPERGQPFGHNAKQFLGDQIAGRQVHIIGQEEDRYGRTIADIYLADRLINRELVTAGLAWHYVKYAADRTDLQAAERTAREQRRGLWDGSHPPIAPWDWRRLSKEERDQWR